MGYRSVLLTAMAFVSEQEALSFLVAYKMTLSPEATTEFEFRMKESRVIAEPGWIGIEDPRNLGVIIWEPTTNMKWYEGEIWTDTMDNMLKAARKAGAATAFIRLGDDEDDAETWHEYDLEDGDPESLLEFVEQKFYMARKINNDTCGEKI